MMPHGITELHSGFWFALHVMRCIPTPPVYCMSLYNVQISHTCLVFVSECSTQSHTAVWFPASLGGSTTTAWQSFLMVFWVLPPNLQTCKRTSLQRLCVILPLYSSCHCLAAVAVQCCRGREPTSWFLIFSVLFKKAYKREHILGLMGVDRNTCTVGVSLWLLLISWFEEHFLTVISLSNASYELEWS